MFSQACVIPSVHRGEVSLGGFCPGGYTQRGICIQGVCQGGGVCLEGLHLGGFCLGVCQGGLHLRVGLHPGWSASRGLYPEGSESWGICIQEGLEQTPQSNTKGYCKLADSTQYAFLYIFNLLRNIYKLYSKACFIQS